MSKRKAPQTTDTRMITALVQLRASLQDTVLPLDLPGADELRASRQAMLDQLDDYVIPRLTTLEAPLLTVVGGSTGAGKSTLVNSIVGSPITASGLLRPTTRSPVLAHHPDDGHWFDQNRVLPELKRVDHATNDPHSIQLVATPAVPKGLAILDAPDVDSVEEQNRLLAAELLAAADLWLFVTSAARYADQVPWEYLQDAAARSAAVAIVLDRTPDEAVHTVTTHLARMLASRGLKDSPLFTVAEGKVDEDGLLPHHHVEQVRSWLEMLAEDAEARTAVVRQTLEGAIRDLTHRVYPVADGLVDQQDAATGLRDAVGEVYDAVASELGAAATNGSLHRGELAARWREFVGTGELARSLDTRVSGIRDRLVNAIKGKPQQAERVAAGAHAAVRTLVLEHAETAAARVSVAWQERPAGPALLAGAGDDLGRPSRDLNRRAEQAVTRWQDDVVELVRSASTDKRTTARFLALGVNGLAVALMVHVFSSRAAEPGTAALAPRLLEAVFGEQELRTLVQRSMRALDRRVAELLRSERQRYLDALDTAGGSAAAIGGEVADRLRADVRRIDDLRYEASGRSVSVDLETLGTTEDTEDTEDTDDGGSTP
jgi:hypothetical protein